MNDKERSEKALFLSELANEFKEAKQKNDPGRFRYYIRLKMVSGYLHGEFFQILYACLNKIDIFFGKKTEA